MKTFTMIRNNDESKISGTGKVLEGAIFSNGQVVVYWTATDINSFGIYKNYQDFYSIHIKSHPTNDTEVKFDNEDIKVKREISQTCRHCKKTYGEHPRDLQWEDNGMVRSCSGNLVELVR